MLIGQVTEQPSADWPHDEADGEQYRGVQLLDDWIAAGKKRICEVERKRGVHIEVVPLHEIAHRSDEDRLEPAPDVGELEPAIFYLD